MADDERPRYTSWDITQMRLYEARTGTKVIHTFAEKCGLYRRHGTTTLQKAVDGLGLTLSVRSLLDNVDSFDGPDDSWKQKTLEENLAAMQAVLKERLKKRP